LNWRFRKLFSLVESSHAVDPDDLRTPLWVAEAEREELETGRSGADAEGLAGEDGEPVRVGGFVVGGGAVDEEPPETARE
jgi:hypothetical protein